MGVYEGPNPVFVEFIKLVQERPRRQRNSAIHIRVRTHEQFTALIDAFLDEFGQLTYKLRASVRAVVVNVYVPMLKIVQKHLRL